MNVQETALEFLASTHNKIVDFYRQHEEPGAVLALVTQDSHLLQWRSVDTLKAFLQSTNEDDQSFDLWLSLAVAIREAQPGQVPAAVIFKTENQPELDGQFIARNLAVR